MNVIILNPKSVIRSTSSQSIKEDMINILHYYGNSEIKKNINILKKILKEDYLILCNDTFPKKEYRLNKIKLIVEQAKLYNADLIYFDVESFQNALPVSDNLFWVNSCEQPAFIIILRKYYKKALHYIKSLPSLEKVNYPSDHKFLSYPFITSKRGNIQCSNTEKKLETLKKINSFYSKNKNIDLKQYNIPEIKIPTYIINLEHRSDRLNSILDELKNRKEFDIHIQKAHFDINGAKGLWLSICQIIEKAQINDDDLVIIMEDDHTFTKEYNKDLFIQNIIEASYQGVEILSGGVSGGILHAFPITNNRYWINHFWGTQFIVIYKKLYSKILETEFKETDTADDLLSTLSTNKMVLFPFISVQKDFGYSDITKVVSERGDLSKIFVKAQDFIKIYHSANQRLKKLHFTTVTK